MHGSDFWKLESIHFITKKCKEEIFRRSIKIISIIRYQIRKKIKFNHDTSDSTRQI